MGTAAERCITTVEARRSDSRRRPRMALKWSTDGRCRRPTANPIHRADRGIISSLCERKSRRIRKRLPRCTACTAWRPLAPQNLQDTGVKSWSVHHGGGGSATNASRSTYRRALPAVAPENLRNRCLVSPCWTIRCQMLSEGIQDVRTRPRSAKPKSTRNTKFGRSGGS